MEKKLFGYPQFDDQGEMILSTYNNEYKAMLMDVRVYRLKAGEKRVFKKNDEEMALLLLKGKLLYRFDGKEEAGERKDVFTDGPYCVHVSKNTEV